MYVVCTYIQRSVTHNWKDVMVGCALLVSNVDMEYCASTTHRRFVSDCERNFGLLQNKAVEDNFLRVFKKSYNISKNGHQIYCAFFLAKICQKIAEAMRLPIVA